MGNRKPWGQGVAAKQCLERNRKANQVVEWVFPCLDQEKIESSGDLWPRGSLIKKLVRGMFQPWIHKAKGRWFTLKVAKLVCRKIWDNLPFTPPRDPKLTFSQYITVQARRLVGLSRASKKLKMADPTLVDTLLDVDAWCLVTCQAVGY
jgi:hypothetical protein